MTLLRLMLLAVLAALLVQPAPARAKVVAILFDTSGSMNDIYRLPAFGMQLLAGTVDGRAGADRLLTLTFDAYADQFVPFEALGPQALGRLPQALTGAVRRHAPTGQGDHQAMIDRLRADFRVADARRGTPYGPIEIILDAAAREAAPGEEVVVIVISDGEYNDEALNNGQARAELQRRFEAYRDAFRGPVRAEYLFIADPGRQGILRSLVEQQGVRDAFLSVFNGPDRGADGQLDGSWFVSDAAGLWDALRDIVARVSGTDRAAQRAMMQVSGNTVTLDTPLSIVRLVAVSTAEGTGAPVRLVSDSFGKPPSEQRDLTARMTDPDTGLRAGPRTGAVRQMWYLDAVAAGRHTLTFDRPVDDSMFLLFQTNAIARLEVRDAATDRVLPPDPATGTVRLLAGRSYRFVTQVLDGPGPAVVGLASLPQGLAMTLDIGGPQSRTGAMTVDPATDRGIDVWTAAVPGRYTARSQVRMPGFASPWSNTLGIEVIDRAVQLTLSPLEPVDPCPGCGPGTVASGVTPGQTETRVGDVTLSASGQTDGAVSLADTRLPDGYQLRDAVTGTPVDLAAPLPFKAGESRRFSVFRMGQATAEEIRAGAMNLTIAAAPAGDWAGDAVVARTDVVLTVGTLDMALVSVARSPSGGPADTLEVPGNDLRQGLLGASFSLVGLLEPPEPDKARERVAARASGLTGGLIGFDPVLTGPGVSVHGLDLRPVTALWCLCGLGLENIVTGSDRRSVAVSYTDRTGLQQADAVMQLAIPVPGGLLGLSCLLNVLALIFLAMVLRGIWALFTTQTFPRNAVAEIAEGNAPPRFRRLDRGSGLWWRAWFALFTGNPDQVQIVEGLTLRATGGGAILEMRKLAPPWTLERMGESLAEMKRNRPSLVEYKLIWGDRLQHDLSPNLSVRLKKRAADL